MSNDDESSDTSEYLDFQSPTKVSEDSNSLDWDNHQEQLSFVEAPESNSPTSDLHRGRVIDQFIFGSNPEDPYSRWPPTNPQSETDHNILESEAVVLHNPEDTVVAEEDFPDVFSDDGNLVICDSVKMPPKKKTADELYLSFESGLKIWDTKSLD